MLNHRIFSSVFSTKFTLIVYLLRKNRCGQKFLSYWLERLL